MPEDFVPLDGVKAPALQQPEQPENQNPAGAEEQKKNAVVNKRMRNLLIMFLGLPYFIFIGWCVFLLSFFPHPAGAYEQVMRFGVLSCIAALVIIILFGGVFFFRIVKARGIAEKSHQWLFLKTLLILLPGIVLGLITPVMIMREPSLYIEIVHPTKAEDFVAPLSVTFSLDQSLKVMEKRGVQAVSFGWDFDGDGQANDQTVVPEVTAFYEKPGLYTIVSRVTMDDGSMRRVTRPFRINDAVFSVSPLRPIVDEPVKFSLAHLLTEEITLKEARWDFNDDGDYDLVTTEPEAVHTFYITGYHTIRVLLTLSNQKRDEFVHTIEIYEPEPLLFPVSIITEPEILIGPSPLGVIFKIKTEEPLKEVRWDYGDGKEDTGAEVGHTFSKKGNFAVTAEARSITGEIAKLTKIVQVVDNLRISDLRFNGEPTVNGDEMSGQVPVTVDLTPVTSLPLVKFYWEAPDATVLGSTETTLQAIYRREGTYTITLLAHDPDGKAARIPLTLEVKPPVSQVSIHMDPEGGTAPLLVHFDSSETVIPGEEITGFEWVFGTKEDIDRKKLDDVQHRGAQVEYLFEKPGTYAVYLKARTTKGNVYDGTKTIVVRAPVLDACFTASRTGGEVPLGIKFDMSCTTGSPVKIEWNFGDGTTADIKDPVHVFEDAGLYEVLLKLTDNAGSISTHIVSITAR